MVLVYLVNVNKRTQQAHRANNGAETMTNKPTDLPDWPMALIMDQVDRGTPFGLEFRAATQEGDSEEVLRLALEMADFAAEWIIARQA